MMEVSRESCPDAAKTQNNSNNSNKNRGFTCRPAFKKVQVVYYLSRNGHLEHPHYMEVTHLAHRHLLLKDVMDRLTVLRGKGMPSLYSWSCKRSYKNGYVWNDLAENDVIYPCEGAEYILKGSELIKGSSENFQMLQVSNSQQFQLVRNAPPVHDGDFLPKRKPVAAKRYPEPEEVQNNNYGEENEEEDDEEEEYEEKISYSTEGNQLRVMVEKDKNGELTRDDSSPPSTISSLSEKGNDGNNTSKRFEDGDPVVAESLLSRNSILFQLISCGGSAPFRGKNLAPFTKQPPPTVGRKSSSGSSLQKEVLIRAAARATPKAVLGAEDEEEIKYMSENPRFGNMQSEEKEYFSGSIVEAITTEERAAEINPCSLKKSNSYNEERSCKAGLGEGAEKEAKKRGKSEKGKCIPIKKYSSSKHSKK